MSSLTAVPGVSSCLQQCLSTLSDALCGPTSVLTRRSFLLRLWTSTARSRNVLVHFGLGGRSLLVFIDGALAGSSPALRDGCLVTICQQASECLTEPLASLFPAFPALRLLQFQVPLPTCISVLARARRAAAHFAVPIGVSSFRREFLFRMAAEAQAMQAAVELGQHSARLAFCCPAFGVCHFSAGFRVAPTARQLRPFLRETWPLLDNHLIADTGEFFGDSTFYALTHPSCPLTAWLRAGHEGEDVLFLPIDVRPTDGIPCPPGFHAHVFRHEGAWGLYAIRPGPAGEARLGAFMSRALTVLAAADAPEETSLSEGNESSSCAASEEVPGPPTSVTADACCVLP